MTESSKTVVLVSKNSSDAAGVQSAIAKLPDVRLEEHKSNLSELNGKSIDLASQHELIIFRADKEAEKDIEAIASIRNAASRKSTLIALATDTTSLADVQRLKRAGVHDVIPETLTTEELRDLIESSTRYPVPAIITVAAGAMPLGRVITIAKARGGIGASLLAVNLADSLLGRQGRLHKVAQNRVIVVDLDMQFGSIASLLDVDPSEALFELASDGADPDWTFLDQSIVEHKTGLCVLAAPASFVPLEAINPKQMGRLVEILGQKFDYVVIDLPRALVGWLAPILEQTDRMLMVTDSSVPSIRQARRLIDFYTEENLDLNVEIVINNEKKPVIKARHHIEASRILERPFVHWLPEDPKAAREATDRGQPLSMAAKRSALAKSIIKLGRATVVELAKKEENQAAIKG